MRINYWPTLTANVAWGGVVLVAAIQVIAAAFLLITEQLPNRSLFPQWAHVTQMSAFALTSAFLFILSEGEKRALYLATTFLLIAATYGLNFIKISQVGTSSDLLLAKLPVDAFLPYFAWCFFSRFPRTPPTKSVRQQLVRETLAVLCTFLFAANLFAAHVPFSEHFSRADPLSPYWAVVYGIIVVSMVQLVRAYRKAVLEERQRVRVLVFGFLFAGLPVSLYLVLLLLPSFREIAYHPVVLSITVPLTALAVVAVPVTTTYALLVDLAVTSRPLSNTARYYAGRVMLLVFVSLPLIFSAWYLWSHSDLPLGDLFRGVHGVVLFLSLVSFLGLAHWRSSANRYIKRLLYRDDLDLPHLLQTLQIEVFSGHSPEVIALRVNSLIQAAMHLDKAVLFWLADSEERLVDPLGIYPEVSLSDSQLVRSGEPLLFDERSIETLAFQEQRWIVDGNFAGTCAIKSNDGSPIGLLGFSGKKNQMAFSRTDLSAVRLLCNALVGLLLQVRTPNVHGGPLAALCSNCLAVAADVDRKCPACSGTSLKPLPLPLRVAGKYLMQKELGRGASGVVYEALETSLSRQVAVKTLPKLTPSEALALRREALTVASLRHPNLETIYALETYKGIPLLILELMESGTLADRLAVNSLPVSEMAHVARCICEGLRYLHANGVLHRDIKPGNIGFTSDNTAKLLDFGISLSFTSGQPVSSEDYLHATLPYASPQIVLGEAHGESADLWALSVTLLESVTGKNPFAGGTVDQTIRNIVDFRISELESLLAGKSDGARSFFLSALDPVSSNRPGTTSAYLHLIGELDSVP